MKKRKETILTKSKKNEIDFDIIDQLFVSGCSANQVASYFDMRPAKLYELIEREKKMPVAEYVNMKKEKGDCQLLSVQHRLAVQGNTKMLIWAGKNRLGQSDSIKQTIETDSESIQKYILEFPDNGRRFIEDPTSDRTTE